jgi:plasmid replication initiation protein
MNEEGAMEVIKRDQITKTNPLIQASYSLSANEMKLIGLAIVHARETGLGINADKPLTIAALDFAAKFNVAERTAYDDLKNACKTLFDRQATYDDIHPATGKPRKNLTRWVSSISYIEGAGLVQFTFAPQVIPMIAYIDGRVDGYTSYFLDEISGLKSAYAIRLFEILMQWKNTTKQTPVIAVAEFRGLMGILGEEYPLIADLKKRVIDTAIKQINENTDFVASYEQKKTGRAITGLIFKFKDKKPALEHQKPKQTKGSNPLSGVKDWELFYQKHKLNTAESMDEFSKRIRKEADEGTFSLSPTD